jgi:hypothetical protein
MCTFAIGIEKQVLRKLKNEFSIFKSLNREPTCSIFELVRKEGTRIIYLDPVNDIQTIQNKISDTSGEIVMYQPDETIRLEVRLGEDTVWLSQQQMAELFQKDQSVIARHVKNVFNEGELDEKSNMQILHNTKYKYRPTKVYNLDVIISVGYRVKSKRGVQFRKWANKVLKQYLIKGYAVNERMRHEQIGELRQLVSMLGRVHRHEALSTEESEALPTVLWLP